jgi:hypothetical protein
MPPNGSYYFSFYNNQFDRIFYSRMYADRCEYIKKNGERCKRRCCIGIEYCTTHLPMHLHLKIKKSTIPNAGLGLFAYQENSQPNQIVFRKDQKICNYKGEILTAEQINERYHNFTAPYTVGLSRNEFIDASLERGVGSTANTKTQHNNATLSIDNRNHRVSIKASRNIRQGEEIFLAYGNRYHLPHVEGVHYYTKKYATKY